MSHRLNSSSLTNSAVESVRNHSTQYPSASICLTKSLIWSCVSFFLMISWTSTHFEYSSTMSENPVFPLIISGSPVTASQWIHCISFSTRFSLSCGTGSTLAFAILHALHFPVVSAMSVHQKLGIFPLLESLSIIFVPGCPRALCHI